MTVDDEDESHTEKIGKDDNKSNLSASLKPSTRATSRIINPEEEQHEEEEEYQEFEEHME